MDAAIPVRLDLPRAPRVASISEVSADSRTDAELIGLVAAGDHRAFEELHRRYARPVLGIALRRIGDRGRAEDATQDTFASLWRSAGRFDPTRGKATSWLFTVARNAIVDGLRRRPEATVEAPPGRAGARARARRRGRERVGVVARAPRSRDAARPGAHASSSSPTGAASRSRRSPTTSAFRSGRSRRGRDPPCAGSRTSWETSCDE